MNRTPPDSLLERSPSSRSHEIERPRQRQISNHQDRQVRHKGHQPPHQRPGRLNSILPTRPTAADLPSPTSLAALASPAGSNNGPAHTANPVGVDPRARSRRSPTRAARLAGLSPLLGSDLTRASLGPLARSADAPTPRGPSDRNNPGPALLGRSIQNRSVAVDSLGGNARDLGPNASTATLHFVVATNAHRTTRPGFTLLPTLSAGAPSTGRPRLPTAGVSPPWF